MSKYETIKISLSKHQHARLARSHNVQLKPEQLHHPQGIEVRFPRKVANKIHKAYNAQRGIRVMLAPHDLEIQGAGFWDQLKAAGQWLKSHIIDTPFYQQNVKPIVKDVVNSAVSAIPVQGAVKNLIQQGANAIGSTTGAYGIRRKKNSVFPMIMPAAGLPDFGEAPRTRKPHMVKGSEEARAYMAHIRSMRGKGAQGRGFRAAGSY